VPPGDAEALAAAVARALADRREALRRADGGRELATRELSLEAFGSGIREVLATVGVCP